MRSLAGMSPLKALSTEVLPDEVPPETITFFRSFTIAFSSRTPFGGMLPNSSSFSIVSISFLNLRMERIVPFRLIGGMVA